MTPRGLDFCADCKHSTGRHDPDYGSCDQCGCTNRSLIELDEGSQSEYDLGRFHGREEVFSAVVKAISTELLSPSHWLEDDSGLLTARSIIKRLEREFKAGL